MLTQFGGMQHDTRTALVAWNRGAALACQLHGSAHPCSLMLAVSYISPMLPYCCCQVQEEEGGGSGGASGGCSGQAAYESVRSFCLLRPTVAYVDLLASFYELSEDQLGKVLDGLIKEGLIQVRTHPDTWTVGNCIMQMILFFWSEWYYHVMITVRSAG